MKIQTNYDMRNHNTISFEALNIKSPNKWPNGVIKILKENNELQKLVEYGEKKGVDIIAETLFPSKENSSALILLSDSYNNILGYFSSVSFQYDLFKASYIKFLVGVKNNTQNGQKGTSRTSKYLKKLHKSIKKYLQEKMKKFKHE